MEGFSATLGTQMQLSFYRWRTGGHGLAPARGSVAPGLQGPGLFITWPSAPGVGGVLGEASGCPQKTVSAKSKRPPMSPVEAGSVHGSFRLQGSQGRAALRCLTQCGARMAPLVCFSKQKDF